MHCDAMCRRDSKQRKQDIVVVLGGENSTAPKASGKHCNVRLPAYIVGTDISRPPYAISLRSDSEARKEVAASELQPA